MNPDEFKSPKVNCLDSSSGAVNTVNNVSRWKNVVIFITKSYSVFIACFYLSNPCCFKIPDQQFIIFLWHGGASSRFSGYEQLERTSAGRLQGKRPLHIASWVVDSQQAGGSSRPFSESVRLFRLSYELNKDCFSECWIEHEMKAFNWILIALSALRNVRIREFVLCKLNRVHQNGKICPRCFTIKHLLS